VIAAGDLATLRRYHEATKHFPGRPSSTPYGLEWDNQPDPFRRYPGVEPVAPPEDLDRLLRLGAGVHPRRGQPWFRTFMSAGALHPVELYVATSLWHFHPGEGTLRRLRDEDPRRALAQAAAAPEVADAAAVLILTGILWRTAWKYGTRGWRHLFWDAGTMLANLLVLADDAGLEPRLLTAFVDAEVAEVLGVDPPREAPIALLVLGRSDRSQGPERLEPTAHRSPPLSRRDHRFPDAEKAQAASSLETADEVRAWRAAARELGRPQPNGAAPPGSLEQTILSRGSARDFTPDPISADDLAAVAHKCDGLEPGAYRYEAPNRFELASDGVSRRATAHVALDQPLGGNAAATLFFTADLDRVLTVLGGRGYRAAQLDAGIRSGRVSLGAYARGLGATGLTFYDDEVRRYLGTKEEPMMCVAVGVDAARPALRSTAHVQ
jgi:SagB-type dehydrogenase family enzyme